MDNYPRHLVTVSALVTNELDEVLLICSPRRGWEFPGGQVEEGESLIAGLRREIQEESGVIAEIGELVGIYTNLRPPSQVNLGFLAKFTCGTLQTSPESLDVGWFARSDVLAKITHQTIYDRVQDMLNFSGKIVYRVYHSEPYTIHEECWLSNSSEKSS